LLKSRVRSLSPATRFGSDQVVGQVGMSGISCFKADQSRRLISALAMAETVGKHIVRPILVPASGSSF